jgi:DNA repair exonuclease SbcCD nuclease subunit
MKTFNTVNGKAVVLTDTHFGARTDSVVFQDYFMKFFQKEFFPFLIKNDIKIVIFAGDFVDRRKYINYVTLNKIRKYFIERLKKLGITFICIVGNHDTFFKNTNEINSIQELFSEYKKIVIFTEPEEVMFDETKVLIVPWINESNYDKSIELINNTDAEIVIGHLEISGFIMTKGQRSDSGFDPDLFSRFKAVYSGHYHHKSTQGNITYLGAPYEMTFADLNEDRGFYSWKTDSVKLKFHSNPYKMFHKLFYADKDKIPADLLKKVTSKFENAYVKVIVQNRTNLLLFDQFMDRLVSMGPADIKIEENIQLEETDDIDVDLTQDTLSILNLYVDNLDIEADKEKIKEELKLLYTEASNMER